MMPMPKTKLAIALLSVCIFGSGQSAGQSSGPSATGELSGKVVDDADDAAVPGASIQASKSDGTVVASATSGQDGSYRMRDLSSGARLVVTFEKDGYAADAHPVRVTAKQDGRVLKLNGDKAYYERKAARIGAIVAQASGEQQQQAWDAQFMAIVRKPIPPSAKGLITRAMLSGAPESIKKSALFEAYATASPAMLKRLDEFSADPKRFESGKSGLDKIELLMVENIEVSNGNRKNEEVF